MRLSYFQFFIVSSFCSCPFRSAFNENHNAKQYKMNARDHFCGSGMVPLEVQMLLTFVKFSIKKTAKKTE